MQNIYFYSIFVLLIVQRISELLISKRNEKRLRNIGAIEYGRGHYKYIVSVHVLFFVFMIAEYLFKSPEQLSMWNYVLILVFIILQILRYWVIMGTLGKRWTTGIFVIPEEIPIRKGLYKYIHHPNYIIVILELMTIPLMFNLFFTAAVISVLNAVVLKERIKEENKALGYRS